MNSKYVLLSYTLNTNTPLYGNANAIQVIRDKSIKKGDSCNKFTLSFSNHAGTHIDAPRHVWDTGRSIGDFSLGSLIFKKPLIIDCPKKTSNMIEIEDIAGKCENQDADILILKTGFQKFRGKNPNIYSSYNPGLSPRAALWIRRNFPAVRAIAIDCISISSYQHRKEGRETHKILLKREKNKVVLIIEDMYIPLSIKKLEKIIVMPLFMQDVDSTPCSILGIYHD